ncbi:MAG: tripartite tricarboxylate transporter substrate binding protein [Pseudomonadota bacterium]
MRLKHAVTGMTMALVMGATWAQTFPTKPVQIVVPYPAGGATDALARNLALRLSQTWGQQVVVDNKPGGNTLIGAQLVAKAPADGYTLLLSAEATLVTNPFLYAKLPYNPTRDFAPITVLVDVPQVLVVNAGQQVSTLPQFIDRLKQQPGKLSYGSFGTGSTGHLNMEKFKRATGTDMAHIPYKGLAPALTDLAGGNVQAMLGSIGSVAAQINSGRITGLAVSGAKRTPILPNIPTFEEAGLKGYDSASWFFLVAPAGTPNPVIDKIYRDTNAILRDPVFVRDSIAKNGLEVVANTPAEFAVQIKREMDVYGKLVKDTGATLDQ